MTGCNTIFIVDPRPLSRHALWTRLAAPGRAFRLFADARSALAALAREKPALVVADLDLPDIDGVALLAQMRARLPLVATVLVSGTETPVGARVALQDRIIDALVARPVENLDDVVHDLLREPWDDWLPIAV
jgi:DNA-binding NtrC family response regulator